MSNLYDATIPVFTKFLTNLDRWLAKAVAYAEHKKFDPERFLTSRLALDQYDLIGQVQSACDQAKFTVAKLTGKAPPSHPDTEKTLAEIRARIKTVVAYLGTFKPEQIDGTEEKDIVLKIGGTDRTFKGMQYLLGFAYPNFYFHVTTTYNMLRHNGVEIGKKDYLGG